MGRRIREKDWSESDLGPPEGWPQSLRSPLSICLRSSSPMAIYWGEDLRLLYNDAWSFIPGPRHPEALGEPARDVWPDIWEIIEPQLRQVWDSREGLTVREQMLPMQRFGQVEETYWDYSFTPIIGEDGSVVGIFNEGQEATERIQQRRRDRLLIALDEAIRPLHATGEILDTALALLAEEMPAHRLWFGEVQNGDTMLVESCWTDGSLPRIEGPRPLPALGEEIAGQVRRGEVLRINDGETDPLLDAPGLREMFRAAGLGSGVLVPLTEQGRVLAAMFAHRRDAFDWADHHVALLSDVVQRLWEAVGRSRAETELRDSEARLRLIFETAHDIIFTATLDQVITTCNPAACKALGLPEERIVGRSISDFVPEEDFKRTRQMLQQKLKDGGTTRYDVTVVGASGEKMLWEINSTLATDRDGNVIGLHAIGRDITERRAEEDRQALLVNELNHRVKNTLALVQGLAMQSFREGRDPEQGRLAFQERLVALAAAHDLLTREKWEGATIADVVHDASAPLDNDRHRIEASGPRLRIKPRAAVSLAMAVHELCTNAAKYGALSKAGGRVSIDWRVEGDRLTIEWRERGGPAVEPPEHRGFGLRMLERALASDLGGKVEIDFAPEGLVCTIEAPLPRARLKEAAE